MEFVYVVSVKDLFADSPEIRYGFVRRGIGTYDCYNEIVNRAIRYGYFVERSWAEEHPEVRQVIPYCVLMRKDEVFAVQRLAKSGESRLRGKLSVGIGGHINPVDAERGRETCIHAAALRELQEEVNMGRHWSMQGHGIIVSSESEVDKVHLGVVYKVAVSGDVTVRENEVLKGGWIKVGDLAKMAHDPDSNMESWSRLVLQQYR